MKIPDDFPDDLIHYIYSLIIYKQDKKLLNDITDYCYTKKKLFQLRNRKSIYNYIYSHYNINKNNNNNKEINTIEYQNLKINLFIAKKNNRDLLIKNINKIQLFLF